MSSLVHLQPHEREAIAEYLAQLQRRFPERILAVTLFGSQARGESEAESDIDLWVLVDVESDEFRNQLWRLAFDVSLEFNVVLSPHVFGQTRWAEIQRLCLPLYRAIMAEGISLSLEPIPV